MNETPLYAPPATVSLGESLHLIFTHYCSPWKSSFAEGNNDPEQSQHQQSTMDGPAFARMCREAPELDQFIGRTEIDLIFSKTKPPGVRRLSFDHFLDALLALAVRIYPEENPTIALANFLARFIFALFDQPPSPDGVLVIDKILNELVYDGPEANHVTINTTTNHQSQYSPGGVVSGLSHSPGEAMMYYQSTSGDQYYEYEM